MPYQDWGAVGQINRIRQLYLAKNIRVEMMHEHHLEVVIGTLTNGGTAAPAPVEIASNADFLWMGNVITPHPDQSNTSVGPAGFATLMKIQLQRQSAYLGQHRDTASNGPGGWLPMMNVCGRGRMPFFWPWPILLHAADQVTFEFLHRGSVDLEDARLSLVGIKIIREAAA